MIRITILLAFNLPAIAFEFWKPGISVEVMMDSSNVHSCRQRDGLFIQACAADQHDFFIIATAGQRRVDTVGNIAAAGTESGIAGYDDVAPTGQWLANRFESLAPHDDRLPHRGAFEKREVGWQMPG